MAEIKTEGGTRTVNKAVMEMINEVITAVNKVPLITGQITMMTMITTDIRATKILTLI